MFNPREIHKSVSLLEVTECFIWLPVATSEMEISPSSQIDFLYISRKIDPSPLCSIFM